MRTTYNPARPEWARAALTAYEEAGNAPPDDISLEMQVGFLIADLLHLLRKDVGEFGTESVLSLAQAAFEEEDGGEEEYSQ